jgi:hypothetical protein
LLPATVVFSWLMFTASVPATPGATLVIALLPASMPVTVTLGPPTMVRPLLSIFVLPVVTELKTGSADTSTRIWLPVRVTVVLLPLAKSAVPPGAMFCGAPPLALRFHPLATVPATSVIAELVAKSCEPLMASVEVPEIRPAATLVIVRSAPPAPTLTVLVGAMPWKL